jgi:hypothetical protein
LQKATKRERRVWGYNWAALSLEDINTETWYSRFGVGRKADELFVRRTIVAANLEKRKLEVK